MGDPIITTALCLALEKSVALALRYDPASKAALAKLSGKILALEITQPSATLYIAPNEEGLSFYSAWDGEVDARIQGSALALANLATAEHLNLANAGVSVFGDTMLLFSLQKIASQLDIDWEDALCEIFGDIIGTQIARVIRNSHNWAHGSRRSLQRLVSEYLTEELQATPSRNELEVFSREVDELRLAGDRLAAKLKVLKERSGPA